MTLTACGASRHAATAEATVYARVEITLPMEGGESEVFGGQLRMRPDEIIRLSFLTPIVRSEAVRVELTPQRLLVIDRTHRRYADEPLDVLGDYLNRELGFRELQTYLTERCTLSDVRTEARALAPTPPPASYTRLTFDELIQQIRP
jgi:hypothetical protein